MTLTELAMAKPGETLGHVRHGGGQLTETDVTRGVMPESSDLAASDARVFVTTDALGRPDVIIGMQHIHDGKAELGIETIERGSLKDPSFMQKLVVDAMARSGVEHVSLDPQVVAVPERILPQAGFQPDAAGEAYTFSVA